jgi:hypothetical protein
MLFDPYLAQRLAEERINRLREGEEARLIRAAKSHKKVRGWWPSLALMLSSLVGLTIRPQS